MYSCVTSIHYNDLNLRLFFINISQFIKKYSKCKKVPFFVLMAGTCKYDDLLTDWTSRKVINCE